MSQVKIKSDCCDRSEENILSQFKTAKTATAFILAVIQNALQNEGNNSHIDEAIKDSIKNLIQAEIKNLRTEFKKEIASLEKLLVERPPKNKLSLEKVPSPSSSRIAVDEKSESSNDLVKQLQAEIEQLKKEKADLESQFQSELKQQKKDLDAQYSNVKTERDNLANLHSELRAQQDEWVRQAAALQQNLADKTADLEKTQKELAERTIELDQTFGAHQALLKKLIAENRQDVLKIICNISEPVTVFSHELLKNFVIQSGQWNSIRVMYESLKNSVFNTKEKESDSIFWLFDIMIQTYNRSHHLKPAQVIIPKIETKYNYEIHLSPKSPKKIEVVLLPGIQDTKGSLIFKPVIL